MGRLAGFKHRDVARKLRALGFTFDRQAAGNREIWRHAESGRTTDKFYGRDVKKD